MFKMNKKGWVTAAALAVLAGNVQAQAVAPFSNTGVSGAVLATMLDQSAGSASSHADAVSGEKGSATNDVAVPPVNARSGVTRYSRPSNPTMPPLYNVAERYA